jgi:hypothetical protein
MDFMILAAPRTQEQDELVEQVKVYPLSKATDPPAQRLFDMSDVVYDGLVKYDETFFSPVCPAC